ncbi:large subunit ribosomal protein L54 [Geosmithia morbida]|uniref:Large ribosomal subunit protein mL54 n=1 Tax=Geosmithia morbida TaxID=1094350 RepID=A0A9P5D542_9HYPO|nr:large subunit ribosomal protein L54 [Geosmithia morbida]KAF4123395.1 large subunit ribosomal protein L54 [Geosmithia morbida]
MFCTRCFRAALPRAQVPLVRTLSTSMPLRSVAASNLSTPVTAPGEAATTTATTTTPRSSCPEGTVITGLNYLKDGQDPVAMKDEDYPEWLWDCLSVMKRSDAADDEAGDEFSKSKKQRKLAGKRKRAHDAKLLAEGDLEALEPKIPIQEQSINLPGNENGSVQDNIDASQARQALKRAMRIERKAKIKEANYLQSM